MQRFRSAGLAWCSTGVFALAACATAPDGRALSDAAMAADPVPTVIAQLETPPVHSRDDAADDPAIWVNPDDPARSLILGTDKQRGLHIYNLRGEALAFVPLPAPNNVDLRQGFAPGLDLAVTSNRGDTSIGVLRVNADGATPLGSFASSLEEPYGVCIGRQATTAVIVVTHKTGAAVFYTLDTATLPTGPATAPQSLDARVAGRIELGTQLEGCVFDEANATIFIGREADAILAMRLDTNLLPAAEPTLVDQVGSGTGLAADIEGLSILPTSAQGGFLIASSQGNHSYAVYDRKSYAPLGRFRIVAAPGDAAAGIDGAEETDGLAAAIGLPAPFSDGLLVVQDGYNDDQAQNFKFVDWSAVRTALGLSP